jgi:hypothetical protein
MPTISSVDTAAGETALPGLVSGWRSERRTRQSQVLRRANHLFRRWRRKAKALLPYVRRGQYAKLERRYAALTAAIAGPRRTASDAWLVALKSVSMPLHDDVCLFVSHHRTPELQAHVVHHVEQLLGDGIQVVLVLNADTATAVRAPAGLAERLHGLYVRENVGFDFAAWAHVHGHLGPLLQASRLYLVNDSVVGPIDAARYRALVARVRASGADLVGLTEAHAPVPHLQSYFLVLQHRLARSPALARFFGDVCCFADKASVIDVYELHFTQQLRELGFRAEALFPALADDRHSANDLYFRWDELLDLGFPFVKASVMREFAQDPRMQQVVRALPHRT